MEKFRERFGQPVRKGLRHDGIVIIMIPIELCAEFFQSQPRRDGERPDVILPA